MEAIRTWLQTLALCGLAVGALLIGVQGWLPTATAQDQQRVSCRKIANDLADHIEYGAQAHLNASLQAGGGAFALPLTNDKILVCAW